jgi:anti-anti-sigma regulatory factor
MLKIRRSTEKGIAVFDLSGRIDEEDIAQLEKLLDGENEAAEITLNLEEVRLVDRQAVRFLAACQDRGIRLSNCPSYVREWMGVRSNKP